MKEKIYRNFRLPTWNNLSKMFLLGLSIFLVDLLSNRVRKSPAQFNTRQKNKRTRYKSSCQIQDCFSICICNGLIHWVCIDQKQSIVINYGVRMEFPLRFLFSSFLWGWQLAFVCFVQLPLGVFQDFVRDWLNNNNPR